MAVLVAAKRKRAASAKESVTPRIDADVLARARGAVIALIYSGKSCSLQELIELSLIYYMKKLERSGIKINPIQKGVLRPGSSLSTTTTVKRKG